MCTLKVLLYFCLGLFQRVKSSDSSSHTNYKIARIYEGYVWIYTPYLKPLNSFKINFLINI